MPTIQRITHNRIIQVFLILIAYTLAFYAIYTYMPYKTNDWDKFYSHIFINFKDPYLVPGFVNPPWLTFLVPYGLLPIRISNAINLLINITVLLIAGHKMKSGWLGIFLLATCPLFWDTVRLNGIEWVPLLGFLLPAAWSMPLLAIKPQSLGLSALIKWKKTGFKWTVLIPLVIVVLLSFLLWGKWFDSGIFSMVNYVHNFSFWPVSIPVGLFLLYKAWTTNDELLGAAATPFLSPYVAAYSLSVFLMLLSGKHKKYAIIFYLVIWWYFIVEGRRSGLWV